LRHPPPTEVPEGVQAISHPDPCYGRLHFIEPGARYTVCGLPCQPYWSEVTPGRHPACTGCEAYRAARAAASLSGAAAAASPAAPAAGPAASGTVAAPPGRASETLRSGGSPARTAGARRRTSRLLAVTRRRRR
jgi:hypothetical protein